MKQDQIVNFENKQQNVTLDWVSKEQKHRAMQRKKSKNIMKKFA